MQRAIRHVMTGLVLLSAVTWLTGCGFHLRGAVSLAPPLKQLYVETQSPYSELTRNLTQALRNAHVQVVDNPAAATTILAILSEATTQQLLSVGGTQQTRQYNLNLTVTFQVTNTRGVVLIPPQIATETHAITVQANQVLGGSNEENNIYRQMRRAIVYTILNRLSSKAATESVMQNHPTP